MRKTLSALSTAALAGAGLMAVPPPASADFDCSGSYVPCYTSSIFMRMPGSFEPGEPVTFSLAGVMDAVLAKGAQSKRGLKRTGTLHIKVRELTKSGEVQDVDLFTRSFKADGERRHYQLSTDQISKGPFELIVTFDPDSPRAKPSKDSDEGKIKRK